MRNLKRDSICLDLEWRESNGGDETHCSVRVAYICGLETPSLSLLPGDEPTPTLETFYRKIIL